MKLKGLVTLITGGASGLGKATALKMASHNCKIVIADLNKVDGQKLADEIGANQALYIQTDVSNEEAVKKLISQTVNKFGGVHAAINAAGIFTQGRIQDEQTSGEELIRTLRINTLGAFLVSKYAAIQMAKQDFISEHKERGIVVNFASIAGIEGGAGMSVYATSKGAIIGMTLPLARDLGKDGIRVVALAPGGFKTPMTHRLLTPEMQERSNKQIALGRQGDPAEIAECIASLCMNSYITGEVIRIDGGYRL